MNLANKVALCQVKRKLEDISSGLKAQSLVKRGIKACGPPLESITQFSPVLSLACIAKSRILTDQQPTGIYAESFDSICWHIPASRLSSIARTRQNRVASGVWTIGSKIRDSSQEIHPELRAHRSGSCGI
jgi:hypothetical protein